MNLSNSKYNPFAAGRQAIGELAAEGWNKALLMPASFILEGIGGSVFPAIVAFLFSNVIESAVKRYCGALNQNAEGLRPETLGQPRWPL